VVWAVVPLDETEYDRWWRSAESSLLMARLGAEHDQHHHACLHAEQAAQQAVKGLLFAVGAGSRARGHNLSAVGAAAAEAAGTALLDPVREALVRLARHYLPSRYPDALPGGAPVDQFTTADSAVAISDAECVAGFVSGAWQALQDAAAERSDDERERP